MPIKKLDPIVASRIAAGEVVERPASIVRELLDNSIDAGSSKISLYLNDGGISSIIITDNGRGMTKEDLVLACESHATSKINKLDDIFELTTLGFRGEALCSISAVSRVSISSNGYQIENDNGKQSSVTESPVEKGTRIEVSDLFEKIPARKQFLKRPSAEFSECKKVFLEKALGFENIEFLLFNDRNLEISLPPATKKDRVLDIMSLDHSFIKEDSIDMQIEEEPVKLYAVASGPSCYKRDRGQIKIFMNNRVIDCFAFVQAVTTAYSVALPGGAFPYFYLFIEDLPSLVDFNIHPAKRECKIRNQSSIYSVLTRMIRDRLLQQHKEEKPIEKTPEFANFHSEPASTHNAVPYGLTSQPKQTNERAPFDPSWFDNAKTILSKKEEPKKTLFQDNEKTPLFSYIGQVFNTFLAVEKDNRLLLIDQHAAHERILYEELISLKDVQQLIVPYRFETDSSVDSWLLENSVAYQQFGVTLVRDEAMLWEITSLPAACRKNEEQIADYIKNATGDIDACKKGLFAIIACHAAIKAGDVLDRTTAERLLDKVFCLDALLCPHGRSFVYSISKDELFKEVGRTL